MKSYYVYILASNKNGTLYIGIRNNLIKRVYEHKNCMVEDFTKKYQIDKPPYKFVANSKGNLTHLLRWCTVPGSACDLSIDGNDLGELIAGPGSKGFENLIEFRQLVEYGPHNVDNQRQACALLSIWLYWANTSFALLKESKAESRG